MNTTRTVRVCALLLIASTTTALRADVPQVINHQGRVTVGATNFDGTGLFKFALVSGDGNFVFWSNAPDTTPVDGEPDAAVSLPVTKGLYSVLLGDQTLGENMAAIPSRVFINSNDVRLRVWFDDGTANGSQLLAPDQRIAAVGYAIRAQGIGPGGLPATYSSPVEFSHPANEFSGHGSGLTDLDADNINTGKLGSAFLPVGGNWALGNLRLNIANNLLVVDPINKRVGIGTDIPFARLHIEHDATGSFFGAGIRLSNASQTNFVTGMRVSDDGFFDITNRLNGHTGFARLNSTGTWTVASDRRVKEDIAALSGTLDKTMALNPVSFRYVKQDRERSPDKRIGFIAQDVGRLFPSLITHGDDLLTMDYSGMSVVAISAIQELKREKDIEIQTLRTQNDALEARLARLETMIRER